MRGVFITLEGGEGSGKSTQIKALESRLREHGLDVVSVREPGGTAPGDIGERIRDILLDPSNHEMGAVAELLLYEASRAQLMESTIRPAVEAGSVVVGDRHADSSTAYQGYARGIVDLDTVKLLNTVATGGVRPDLTLFLDVDPSEGLASATTEGADRLEREEIDFHQRVREGFLKIAAEEPDRVVVIERSTPDEVAEAVWARVERLLVDRGVLE